jgi:hypothetical protein
MVLTIMHIVPIIKKKERWIHSRRKMLNDSIVGLDLRKKEE